MEFKNRFLGVMLLLYLSFSVQAQQRKKLSEFSDWRECNKTDEKGRKQGKWYILYSDDSTVSFMLHYVDDVKNGYFENYRKGDRIGSKGYYKNGKFDSTLTTYWDNGMFAGEDHYVDGQLHGIVTYYDSLGNLLSRYRYINGVEDTTYEDAYENPNIIPDAGTQYYIEKYGVYQKPIKEE